MAKIEMTKEEKYYKLSIFLRIFATIVSLFGAMTFGASILYATSNDNMIVVPIVVGIVLAVLIAFMYIYAYILKRKYNKIKSE